jgi:hypothetical protein
MKYVLNTPYKGSRHYVQGGDLFNSISQKSLELFQQRKPYVSQLSFSNFAYHLCNFVVDESADIQSITGKGVITFDDATKKHFYLTETSTVPSERVPFDEDGLVAKAKYTERSIQLSGKPPFSSIETVIALTKALSYKNMPPHQGKWVFGRIDLTRALPEISNSVIVESISSVAGRFGIYNIVIEGDSVGNIQFIVGAP